MHLNWVAKIELRARALWSSIFLLNTVVRGYCCTLKMLKENETKETTGFFVTFLSLVSIQL